MRCGNFPNRRSRSTLRADLPARAKFSLHRAGIAFSVQNPFGEIWRVAI
jgi:hypothetical protein